MFDVDNIASINLYLDENDNRICEINGFDNPISKSIGSCIKHDNHSTTAICSAEDFKAFAEEYNRKRHEAAEI